MRIIAALAIFAIGVALQGRVPDKSIANYQQWSRTTAAECRAETDREYKAMFEAGWCCDPPITMGMHVWFGFLGGEPGDRASHGREPCGHTDSKGKIWPIWEIGSGDKQCELTEAQYEGMYDWKIGKLDNGDTFKSGTFSDEKFRILGKMCRDGKLAVLK